MADDPAEIGRRAADAFAQAVTTGDIERHLDVFDPDIDYASFSPSARAIRLSGREELRAYLARVAPQYDSLRIDAREFRPVGSDRTLMLGVLRARPRGGTEIASPLANLYEVREGRIRWFRGFTDEQQALAAAGE